MTGGGPAVPVLQGLTSSGGRTPLGCHEETPAHSRDIAVHPDWSAHLLVSASNPDKGRGEEVAGLSMTARGGWGGHDGKKMQHTLPSFSSPSSMYIGS